MGSDREAPPMHYTYAQTYKSKERRTRLGYWHGMDEGLGTAKKDEGDQEQGQAFGET